MPKKKVFDSKKLIKMVKDQTHQQEIMKTFGFKAAGQVKAAYFRALVESGEVPKIIGGRVAGKAAKVKPIVVGKRGSIVIPAGKVTDLGIGTGDKFTVRKTRPGIALKKL